MKSQSKEELANFLKKTIYFNKVPYNELEAISEIMEEERYNADDIIFCENDEGDSFYIITKGKVEISISEKGHKKTLAIKKEFDGFGELSIIDKQKRSATVKCLEATDVLKLNKEGFEQLIKDTNGFSSSLAYALTEIVRNNTQLMVNDLKEKNQILERSVTQLQELQDVLVKNERLIAIGKFANKMIHDLKNMLNQIYTTIQLLSYKKSKENKGYDKKTDEYYKVMENAVEQMNELCHEVLEFTQGNVRLEKETVEISKYLKAFIVKMSEQLSYHNITFETNIDSMHRVFIDKTKIDRVLTNIIFNSVDALDDIKDPHITLKCYDDKKTREVVIEITDNGKGISEHDKEHIFDPFFSSGKAHGTGLGLTISQEIITMHHGGKIYVESIENKGTTIFIRLPMK